MTDQPLTRETIERLRKLGRMLVDGGGSFITTPAGSFGGNELLMISAAAEAHLSEPARIEAARQAGYREGIEAAARAAEARLFADPAAKAIRALPLPDAPAEPANWPLDDTDTAGRILDYLGIGHEASREPGADRHRDRIAAMICADREARAKAAEPAPQPNAADWLPIFTAPRDEWEVEVLAPGYHDLPPIQCFCAWHPDAGFCIDELRSPLWWRRGSARPAQPAEPSAPVAEDWPTRCAALEAEVARLRRELEPLAREADRYDPPSTTSNEDMMEAWESRFTIGHLRRARALLQEGRGNG